MIADDYVNGYLFQLAPTVAEAGLRALVNAPPRPTDFTGLLGRRPDAGRGPDRRELGPSRPEAGRAGNPREPADSRQEPPPTSPHRRARLELGLPGPEPRVVLQPHGARP